MSQESQTRPRSDPNIESQLNSDQFTENPYFLYQDLRNYYPVYWSESWGQWLVTRRELVNTVLRQPDTFSSVGYERQLLDRLHETNKLDYPNLSDHYETQVLSRSDPPDHARLRRMLTNRFTNSFLRQYEPSIVSIIEASLSALAGREEFDFVHDFAYPIPALVIAELLGLPEDLHEPIVEWSRDLTAFLGTGLPSPQRASAADQSLGEFHASLDPLIKERKSHAGNDLISLLVAEEDDDHGLNDAEVMATCVTLLFAGHETTANQLANGLFALLTNPGQLSIARDSPDEISIVFEELLRFDSSVQRVRRVMKQDTTLGGHRLRKGDLVMAFLGSANRDEEFFNEPDSLDITRSPNRHMSFGQGIHFCVGASLARIEGPLALHAFLSRYSNIQLIPSSPPVRARNLTFRQFESLPIRVGPL